MAQTFATALAFAPLSAGATSIWTTWVVDSATAATASTPDGRTAAYTGHPVGTNAAGSIYNASPSVPGIPTGENPSYLGTVTGQPHPTLINPGDLIMTIDLANFGVDAETTFGLADMQDTAYYRLELLDAALAPLSLSGVQVTNYNLTYISGGLIADEDITLNTSTGALRLNFIHDAGGTYRHSGLGLFTNLPLATRYIRLYSNAPGFQLGSEGIQIYLGGSAVPEPALATLLAAAALFAFRRCAPR
jgi:hypothetical protein